MPIGFQCAKFVQSISMKRSLQNTLEVKIATVLLEELYDCFGYLRQRPRQNKNVSVVEIVPFFIIQQPNICPLPLTSNDVDSLIGLWPHQRTTPFGIMFIKIFVLKTMAPTYPLLTGSVKVVGKMKLIRLCRKISKTHCTCELVYEISISQSTYAFLIRVLKYFVFVLYHLNLNVTIRLFLATDVTWDSPAKRSLVCASLYVEMVPHDCTLDVETIQ